MSIRLGDGVEAGRNRCQFLFTVTPRKPGPLRALSLRQPSRGLACFYSPLGKVPPKAWGTDRKHLYLPVHQIGGP